MYQYIKQYFSQSVESNIPKMFVHLLTSRRNFIPLLSVYFLMLPDVMVQQVGLFMGISFLAGFLLEIPSGYLADSLGHRKVLILQKLSFLLSVPFFIFPFYLGNALILFTIGAILQTLAFSFGSGTVSAFMHNVCCDLKKEDQFTKILGQMRAKVSLVSIFFILTLPLFTLIHVLVPFFLAIIFDVIGLLNALLFKETITHEENKKKNSKDSVLKIFSDSKKLYFIPFALSFGVLSGLDFGLQPFRTPYMESVGLPLVFIGASMALSRGIWALVSYNIHYLEGILHIRQFILLKIFISIGCMLLVVIFPNPYFLVFIFAINTGVTHGISTLKEKIILTTYLQNPSYKSTVLSLEKQIGFMFQALFVFGLGYVMIFGYQIGFFVGAIVAGIIAIIASLFVKAK